MTIQVAPLGIVLATFLLLGFIAGWKYASYRNKRKQ